MPDSAKRVSGEVSCARSNSWKSKPSPTPMLSDGKLGLVSFDIAVELGVDRRLHRRHRGQREQAALLSGSIASRAGSRIRPRPNRPPSSSRNAPGSMIAVPRSSAASGAARAASALQARASMTEEEPQHEAHAPTNTVANGLFKQKGASHRGESAFRDFAGNNRQRATIRPLEVTTTQRPSCLRMASTRPTPGMLSPAKTSNSAAAALDQRTAFGGVAKHPTFDGRQTRDLGLAAARRRRRSGSCRRGDRSRDVLGRGVCCCRNGGDLLHRVSRATGAAATGAAAGATAAACAARSLLTSSESFASLCGGLALRLLDLVEAVAGLVELGHAGLGVLLDAGFQRQHIGIDAGDGGFDADIASCDGFACCRRDRGPR